MYFYILRLFWNENVKSLSSMLIIKQDTEVHNIEIQNLIESLDTEHLLMLAFKRIGFNLHGLGGFIARLNSSRVIRPVYTILESVLLVTTGE